MGALIRRSSAPRLLVAAIGLLLVVVAPVGAQDPPPQISIDDVDLDDFPSVQFRLLSDGAALSRDDVSMQENDREIERFIFRRLDLTAKPVAIVLAIDTSASTRERNALELVKDAAKRFAAERRPIDEISVVAYSDASRVVVPFTSDLDAVEAGIDELTPGGGTALWDAVVQATQELASQPIEQRYLVVLSDASAGSYENRSTATAQAARDAVTASGVTVFTIGIPSGPVNDAEYRALAEITGGSHRTTTDVNQVGGLLRQVQGSIQNQYEVVYLSQGETGAPWRLTVTAAGATATFEAQTPPTTAAGEAEAPAPEPDDDGLPGWLPRWELLAALWVVSVVAFVMVRRRSATRSGYGGRSSRR